MDKKNVPASMGRPRFFEIFKTRCSESDLGPISLNWFEELSSEALPYDCKISEDAESDCLDQCTFKMPKKKLFTNSQLASTPIIFKERSISVSEAFTIRTKLDQSNEVISPPANTCLSASPAVLREICRTPLENKYVLNGSVLCTPKVFQVQTPNCISASLGAEADPEMSWSSSLATPPTLSPTVVIAKGDQAASGTKQHNEKLALVMQSLLSEYSRDPGKNSVNIASTGGIEHLCSETDGKNQSFRRLLDGQFGIDKLPNKSNVNQKPSNVSDDEEMHEETDSVGKTESGISECLVSGKTFQKEMKTAKWGEKKYSDKVKHDDLQENKAVKRGSKDFGRQEYETKLNSSKYNLQTTFMPSKRTQYHSMDQNSVQEEMSSSVLSAWSQLDFSGLEITQLEKVSSYYGRSPSNVYVKNHSEDHLPFIVKECANTLESRILNTSSLINVHKLLHINSPENSPVTTGVVNNSPTLVRGGESAQASIINDSESASFIMENTATAEFLETHSCCHHKCSKENSKTSSGSPGDSIVTPSASNERGPENSGLKAVSSLSNFRRRPKKFVYSLMDTSLYREERTTRTDESSSLMSSGAELKSYIPEVSGTATGNEGHTEEPSIGNEDVEEKHKLGFEKSWTRTNPFYGTPCNKKSSIGTDQLPIPPHTDKRNDTSLPSSFIAANQGKESSENKFYASSSKNTSEKEKNAKCAHLSNSSSFQGASPAESVLAAQALIKKNRQAPLELATQHFSARSTQVAELGQQSAKTSKPNVDEPSNFIVLEKSSDLKQPVLVDTQKNTDNGKQKNHNETQCFVGFKTSSNKQIHLSDDDIRRGKLLFKDIQDEFFKDFPCERMQCIPNQNVEENAEISGVRINKLNKNISSFSHGSDSQVSLTELSDTQDIFPEILQNASFQNVLKNQQPEGKQNLTAHEEAEVTELSNILEETGSQFEFTQLLLLQNNACKLSGSTDKNEITELDINSEARKDGFKESCKPKTQTDSDKALHHNKDTAEESSMQKHSNEELTVNLSSRKYNRKSSIPNALPPVQCTLSDLVGCRSAGRKVYAISSETVNNTAKLVSELDCVDEMYNLHKTNFKNSNNSNMCWNNPKYMKEMDIDWHQMIKAVSVECMMKNNAGDTVPFGKENMGKKSCRTGYNEDNIIHISSMTEVNLKIVQRYSVCMTGNELSTVENNHSVLVSHRFVNREETHCNDLQESLSDLTCLVEVTKTEQNSSLNDVDKKENLNSNQQEKKTCSPERDDLVHTTAGQNILVPQTRKNKTFHVLAGCCVGEELDDTSSTSHSKIDIGNQTAVVVSVKKNIDLNQNENLKQNDTIGFHTASGKRIAISDKSLAKARYILAEDNAISEKDGLTTNVSGIQHAIKEKPNENSTKVRKEFEDRIEKCNEVNCSALHCSSDVDNFICIPPKTSPENFKAEDFSTSEETSNNDNCTHQKCDLSSLDANNLLKDLSSDVLVSASKPSKAEPVAFSTANGKAVRISQEALKKVRKFLQNDCYESTKQNMEIQSETSKHGVLGSCSDTSRFQMIDKLSDNSASSRLNHNKSDFPRDPSNSEFFSTASGKPVQLREESLKKARQLFSDLEESNSSVNPSHMSDDSYEVFSVGNKMTTAKCKPLGIQRERLPDIDTNSHVCYSFSTASGKQVHVSEKALQKVTCFFKEIDDNFEDGQSLQQDHISPLEAPCVETKVDDEVTSKSKLQEKCNAFYLTTSIPKENKTSETLSVKPLSESHIEKYKHPAHWGKTFPCTKEIGLLEIHKPCPDRMETKNAAKHDAITEGSLDSSYPVYSQPPENDLETEASESAKAFMEDDELTDSEVQKNKRKRIFVPGKTNHFRSNTRNGKRHIEEENLFGEPPIKRKLLPEFDRSEGCNKSSLKASKTTPEDTMKDRRKFKYNIELKPVISVPFSSSKERQEVRNPNITNPDHNLKGYKSESNNYQQLVSERSSSRQSASWTPFSKTLVEKSKNTEDDYAARKQVNVFVPPFKTKKAGVSEDEIVHSKGYDLLGCKNINRKEKLNLAKIQESTIEPEDSSFENNSATQISLVASEFTDTNSDLAKIIKKFQYARNLQEMRIMKRKTQRICPQPGNLYLVKTSAARCRIPLEAAVNKKSPASYFSEQLYIFGVSRQCVKINSSNAEDFQFLIQDFFSKDYFLEGHGIPLADGGYLVPTDEGKAGKEEFYRALCDTPGVDAKLISKAWVYNHYRWIIWKLAAMEVAFPQEFASKCLTPERVLLQLKYRYDVEVDQSRRSAIKRITERDDVAAKTLVLCISKIISLSENVSHIYDKSPAIEDKREAAVVELTDGWYGIRAVLDSALQSLLRRERLRVGQKIIVHGAELVGSQDASSPLEAPESLMLKISANSSRRARWYAKLGYHKDPRPFCLPLSSLLSDGGNVGCVDVIIQRVYPIQWMEKLSAGSYVFRNERAEEREAAKHKENQLKTMQALLAKIQAKFETNEDEGKRSLRSRILTRQQIRSLQDGAELYEAVLNAPDPAYMEGYFSEEQLKALNSYRQMVNDKKQAQIEAEFRKAVESAEQEAPSSCRRDVTTVMKLRVVDYRKEERGKDVILNIWRPSPDVYTLLKEGGHYRIFHLATSQPKGKLETANIQLTATKKTQYLQLPVSQEALVHIYKPRKCLKFSEMLEPSFQPACSEVDLVGYVVSLRKGISFSVLYLSDESHNLIAVQICADFKQLAIEDIIIPSKLISATNLKWQPKFRSDVPTLFAGDLSAFSSNPKERHLQEKFNELKNTVVKKSHFSKDVQEKLMNLLPVAGPPAFNSPSECGLHPCLSSWKSSARNTHSIATPTSEPRQHNLLTAGKLNSTPSVPQDSEKVTQELQEMAKNFKKRKAMDLLSQVPSPPPVKPICTFVSPSLKKSFQPPRNCDTQHARSLEKTACKSVKKPSLKRLNETCFPLENDFVADEELAMINTQALLNRFPKERKVAFTDRTTYTVLSNSPDSLGETSSQSAEIKNALQDSKEGTKTPRNGTNETKSLVGVQKEQQRQRRKY